MRGRNVDDGDGWRARGQDAATSHALRSGATARLTHDPANRNPQLRARGGRVRLTLKSVAAGDMSKGHRVAHLKIQACRRPGCPLDGGLFLASPARRERRGRLARGWPPGAPFFDRVEPGRDQQPGGFAPVQAQVADELVDPLQHCRRRHDVKDQPSGRRGCGVACVCFHWVSLRTDPEFHKVNLWIGPLFSFSPVRGRSLREYCIDNTYPWARRRVCPSRRCELRLRR